MTTYGLLQLYGSVVLWFNTYKYSTTAIGILELCARESDLSFRTTDGKNFQVQDLKVSVYTD